MRTRIVFALIILMVLMSSMAHASPVQELLSQGRRHVLEGRPGAALTDFRTAADEAQAAGEGALQARALLQTALTRDICGSPAEAMDAYDRALAAAAKASVSCRTILFYRAAHLLKEGQTRQSSQEFEKALNTPDCSPECIPEYVIQFEAGRALLQCGQNNRAFYYGLRVVRDRKVPLYYRLLARWLLAGSFDARGEHDRALSITTDALIAARKDLPDPYMLALFHWQMGTFYLQAGHGDEAVRLYVKAESYLHEPAGHLFLDEPLVLPEFRSALYEGLLTLLVRQGLYREGLYFCLRARDDEARWPYRLLDGRVQQYMALAREGRSWSGHEDSAAAASLVGAVTEAPPADDWYEELIYRLDDRAERLEFFTGQERSFLFTVDIGGVRGFILPEGRRELLKRLAALREVREPARWQSALREARAELLGPAEGRISGRERLLLGLHGPLRAFPWPALQKESGPSLIDEHCLESSSLFFTRPPERERRRESRPLWLLAATEGEDADREVQLLASFLVPRIIVTGEQAAAPRLTAALGQASYAHLAGRWNLDCPLPDLCGLRCTRELLSFRELQEGLLPLEAVMCSDCEKRSPDCALEGLGLLGPLAYRGGSGCLAVTVWEVPLQERLLVTEEFYRSLKKGLEPARALRLAQIKAAAVPGARGWAWYSPFTASGCGVVHGQ